MRIFSAVGYILSLGGVFLFTSCTPFWGERIHSFTEKDSGKVLSCKTGDFIALRLTANPSTGYQWQKASPPDGKVLALAREEFLPPENMEMVGKGGTYFLKYEVIGPGRSGISLKYIRPWEKNKIPAREFQLLIYASGNPKSYIPKEGEEFFLIPPPPKKNLKK